MNIFGHRCIVIRPLFALLIETTDSVIKYVMFFTIIIFSSHNNSRPDCLCSSAIRRIHATLISFKRRISLRKLSNRGSQHIAKIGQAEDIKPSLGIVMKMTSRIAKLLRKPSLKTSRSSQVTVYTSNWPSLTNRQRKGRSKE